MATSVHFVRQLSKRRREQEDIELQVSARKRRRVGKWFLDQIDKENEVAQAVAVCGVILSKKPRQERSPNEQRDDS